MPYPRPHAFHVPMCLPHALMPWTCPHCLPRARMPSTCSQYSYAFWLHAGMASFICMPSGAFCARIPATIRMFSTCAFAFSCSFAFHRLLCLPLLLWVPRACVPVIFYNQTAATCLHTFKDQVAWLSPALTILQLSFTLLPGWSHALLHTCQVCLHSSIKDVIRAIDISIQMDFQFFMIFGRTRTPSTERSFCCTAISRIWGSIHHLHMQVCSTLRACHTWTCLLCTWINLTACFTCLNATHFVYMPFTCCLPFICTHDFRLSTTLSLFTCLPLVYILSLVYMPFTCLLAFHCSYAFHLVYMSFIQVPAFRFSKNLSLAHMTVHIRTYM